MSSQGPGGANLPRWTILSVTTLGSFMAALDTNIVSIALVKISQSFSAGYSLLGWVLVGYILVVAALVLQAGKLGDIYGKKRVYLVGFAIFGISSALCGLSLNVYQLVFFRVIQGIGAAVMVATGLPMIFASFPPSERGKAIGVNSVAWAVGAVIGPILGGALSAIDWRLIFYVNVPVAAVAIAVGRAKIPKWLDARGQGQGRLNLVNAGLLGASIALLVAWLTLLDLRLLVLGAVGAGAFVVAERRSSNPILNRDLLRTRGFVFSVTSLGVLMVAFFGILYVASFYYQSVAGFSPFTAGLWVAPLPVMLGISSLASGRLFDRFRKPATISIAGAFLFLAGALLLSRAMGSVTPGMEIPVLLGVLGVGGGMVWSPSISSALRFAKPQVRGVANGTAFTLINLGTATGIALVIAVSTSALPPVLAALISSQSVAALTPSQAALFDGGLVNALLALAAVGSLGIPLLFLVLREQSKHFTAYSEMQAGEGAPPAAGA